MNTRLRDKGLTHIAAPQHGFKHAQAEVWQAGSRHLIAAVGAVC
jgi:hypothetical protein